ncbi:hypothetical protein ACFYXS_02780 [Streptomyces sp. NPDC002574]|uniref:hypothetical protein n=1 Tax=Streptomyces sp. NPDC002574 TaxID=3364652 RepID=UPI0036AF0BDD
MALNKNMSTAPESRPDSRFETVYDAERGGHYPPQEQPAREQDGQQQGQRAAS